MLLARSGTCTYYRYERAKSSQVKFTSLERHCIRELTLRRPKPSTLRGTGEWAGEPGTRGLSSISARIHFRWGFASSALHSSDTSSTACGVLERSRPTGLLGSRHQLPRVFPGGSHETRLPLQHGNLTAQQTGGLAPVPLHTNLVTQWTAWECMLPACLRDRVWPGRPHASTYSTT